MSGPDQMSSWDAEMTKLGAEGAVEILCRGLAETLRAAPRLPSRASLRFGCASIEVEWPETAADAPVLVSELPEQSTEDDRRLVRAKLVGTFYQSPEPGAKPFVAVGDVVEPGTQVGIVEAMKLMNPVAADIAGRVAEILVGDAEAVEYDQPLLAIEPEPRA